MARDPDRSVRTDPDHTPRADPGRPTCADGDCEARADFWQYDREAPADDREHDRGAAASDCELGWRPVCERHALTRHPSLELKAWLWSEYMVPVERGRPTEPPGEPEYGRTAAFRREVDVAMGWTE